MPAFDASPGGTLVDVLRGRAIATPTATAYEFVEDDGGERIISYAELDALARAVAAALGGERAAGQRALLLYPPGPNYIIGLLGCFYAGVVAVPMYLPTGQRALARVIAAAADAGAALVLSDAKSAQLTRSRYAELAALGSLTWLVTDELPAADWFPSGPGRDDLAFLQYTSGSTGKPKGVMVRHGNLLANSATISAALRIDEHTRGVSWLPPYHDMGLIGGLLQPLYAGFPCTLLTPTMFLRRPYRWLEAISRHRATVSAGPDFGYLECVRRISEQERAQLDLSTWRHALVGAEPVRPSTMAAFQEAFGPVGFRREAFHPCYGLAEATLFVTGGAVPVEGPRLLEVSRAELEQGTAVPGPGVVFTGCGRVQRDEILELVAPDSGKPVAPGTVGEVLVSGDTVTGGYWDQPEETDRVFRARVDGYPDRVFLRTGDLGFQLDGELFITGRIKDLMVVRGRNHYPHDIEQTAERAHPLLQPARAAVFSVDNGTEERVVLVHEVVRGFTPADGPAVFGAVREAVAQAHGLALHEVVLVRPGTIPRTTSGKIQHAATRQEWAAGRLVNLAEPDGDTPVAETSEAARLVAGAVDLLPDKAMPYAPLVALGLDSLRAVRLSATLRERLDIDVPVDKLLGGMTLGQLDRIITDRAASPRLQRPQQTIVIPTEARASRAQQRMWLLDQLGAGNAYHVLGGVRLTGPVDPALLRECLTALVHRYPALRGCFRADADGALVIDVRPPRPLPLPIVDLTELPSAQRIARRDAVIAELGDAPFDLGTGPLLRAVLIKLDAGEWCLGVAAHHIIVDGWSLGVLMRQLGGWYRLRLIGESLPDEQVPLPDQSETGLADDGFWQHALAGATPVDLPLDGAQPLEATWHGASLPFTLPAAQVARLTAYGAGRGATLFMTLLGAFATVLARWTGQSDLVIGAPMAGRDRRVSADEVGLFVNTVPLRVDVSGAPSFGELLGRVRATCLAAYPHQNVPFDEIVRQADVIRSGGRAPLVRAALTLQNVPLTPWQAGEVHAEPFELPAPGAQFELALHLTEQRDGGIAGHVSYAADLFAPDTMRRLLDALDLVLRAVPDFPALPVPDLPMITEAERERVVEVFSGANVPPVAEGLLHEPFERQVDRNPYAIAVIAPDGTLTYGELDAAANRLARLLLARGVRPDEPVAVCLPRGRHLVIALLAVLKAGAAYLPLDTGYPPARLAAQLRDGRPALVLSTKEFLSQLDFETTALDLDQDPAADFPATRPTTVVTPHHLAYVLYTSGTSGIPKGVLNEHAGVSNRIAWMQREYGLVPGEAVLHKTPIGFDVSGWELFWPLSAGATMVLARPGGHQDPAYLARLIREHSVSTCHFVPSMLRVFLEEPTVADCAGVLRRLVCSGEELPPSVAARCHALLPDTELHNLYGPTEAAIDVTAYHVRPADAKRVRLPIGGPIAGAALYVLDPRGRPTAVGVPGELHIGGIQVARGYLNRPALTAERFVPDPARPGCRLYRTGDRVRWLADGTLEFLGRLDQQVKIRGVRIEPADVGAALAAHPAIVDVVVDARRGPDGEARLVGYPVPAGDDRPTDAELRAFLADRLPSVMVPSAFVWLPVLPVGPSGKLDRDRLPEPAANGTGAGHTAPRNEIERWIAEIWCDVLRLSDISVTADFFDLGGHSLLAARIAARIQAEFDVELSVADLLGGGLTVERLAVSIQQAQLEQVDPEELAAALADVVGDFHDFE